MKISVEKLRSIIREQIGRMYTIDNAGFGGMGGVSRLMRHKEVPPPGLGDEGEEEKQSHEQEEQEEFQWTVGARQRKDGKRR
jgi:hypothetical protein